MLMRNGQAYDSTSHQPAPPCSAMLWFLSIWLRKHPQDFCDYPVVVTVKRLVDYIRLNVPSTEVAIQTEELLSMLESRSPKRVRRLGYVPGKAGGGIGDGLHQGVLQMPWPGTRAGPLSGEMSCCGERGLGIF